MRRFPLWPVVLGRPGCRRQPGSRALATRGGDDARREYRYVIDHVGRVHLADSKHTSVATAVNDTQFLDLLYRGMKRGAEPGAVWTQPCQGEVNTLSLLAEGARDAIVVFHSLDADNLRFAGTMCVRFDPEAVGVCGGGFMYHLLPKSARRRWGEDGLIGAPVAHMLSGYLRADEAGAPLLEWGGALHRLRQLPGADSGHR